MHVCMCVHAWVTCVWSRKVVVLTDSSVTDALTLLQHEQHLTSLDHTLSCLTTWKKKMKTPCEEKEEHTICFVKHKLKGTGYSSAFQLPPRTHLKGIEEEEDP